MLQHIEIMTLLDAMEQDLRQHLSRRGIAQPVMVGIHTGGVWLAEHLHRRLGLPDPLGTLDISFYRDDFTRAGLHPRVKPSSMPLATEDQHIVLVDDVVKSGRTVRAALNELFDFGRPASVTLVALIDLNARELPVRPDIIGQTLELPAGQQVKLTGPEPLCLELRQK